MGSARRTIRGTLVMLVAAGVLLLAGCAASEHAAYAHRLTRAVRPTSSANADVALAFGLDEYADVALTAADEQRPP